jgi:hypothetical protein
MVWKCRWNWRELSEFRDYNSRILTSLTSTTGIKPKCNYTQPRYDWSSNSRGHLPWTLLSLLLTPSRAIKKCLESLKPQFVTNPIKFTVQIPSLMQVLSLVHHHLSLLPRAKAQVGFNSLQWSENPIKEHIWGIHRQCSMMCCQTCTLNFAGCFESLVFTEISWCHVFFLCQCEVKSLFP